MLSYDNVTETVRVFMDKPNQTDTNIAVPRSATESGTPDRDSRHMTSYLAWLKQSLHPILDFISRPVQILRTYPTAALKPDLVAGLTVAVIALPQAMAYALIAELPPEMGLYAAIVGAIVGALWGSSHHLQTGPTNTTSLLVLAALLTIAEPGTPEFVLAAGLMALIVGVIQIMLAMAKLGVMVNFISDAVIVGFTAGAGVLIAINQLRHLLRLTIPSLPSLWETAPLVIAHLPETHIPSLAIGIATILIIIVLRKINRGLPVSLIAMILSAAVVGLSGLDAAGVRVVGELPRGLPQLAPLPIPNLAFIGKLATGSIAVAAIALVESLSIARSISAQSGQRLHSNQEFFGQGLANIASGLFSGYVVAGSFIRSVVNHRAGAKTSLANVFTSLFLLIAIFVLAPFAAYVPLSALAGVILVTAYNLVERREIVRIWRSNHGDQTIMLITLVATLTLPLEYAVLLGIALSIGYYLLSTSKPRVRVVLPSDDFRYFTPRPDKSSCTQLGVVEILGDLYFGAASHIEEKILENLEENPHQRFLLLRMYPVENCDISGIHTLESIVRSYRDRGGDVYFVHVHKKIHALMKSTGFYGFVGKDHFLDPDDAIPYLFHRALDPAICIYECPVRVFQYCQNLPKRLDLVCPTRQITTPLTKVPTIAPEALWKALHTPTPPTVIDVREPREFKSAHIPDATHIPLRNLIEDPSQVPTNGPLVMVCQGGRRSTRAAAMLIGQGYTNVKVLENGMSAWHNRQLLTAVEIT
jgi:sulfate permease, SulP family